MKKTTSEMMGELSKIGWIEYYGNSCYKQEWLDDGKPYDRMACSIEDAYESEIEKGNNNI